MSGRSVPSTGRLPFEHAAAYLSCDMRFRALLALAAWVSVIPCLVFAGGMGDGATRAGHLVGQKSPYLLEHLSEPVDWYPWGEEAFQKAKREGKLIFLSIGYSTCHWCHVMENESFSDPRVAALMNDAFVSVVVDREERPDLDRHFMTMSELLTGSGGWPLTIIMMPDGRPFYATTYIPRDTAYGRLGMIELIPRIQETWKTRHAEILQSAVSIDAEIAKLAVPRAGGFAPDSGVISRATKSLASVFDKAHGGFGLAPKFPMATALQFLLRSWRLNGNSEALHMVERTLTAMRNGGIFDQLGYGFHRYSTDATWLVPHFEKMLYDQALLSLTYTEAWQTTRKVFYKRTAREILTYVLRDLALPEGGFAAAQDADSEGKEGKYYLWTAPEVRAALGSQGLLAIRNTYDIREEGNFPGLDGSATGENILHRPPADAEAPGPAESALLAARSARIAPARDDKLLADWNGLMIAALARAGGALDDPDYTRAAERAAQFIWSTMRTPQGRLFHRYRDGQAAIAGMADDYAFLDWGLLELYEGTFDVRYLQQAIELMNVFIAHFWDPAAGGFYQTPDDAERRVARSKVLDDGSLPSANSAALLALLMLNRMTGNVEYEKKAEAIAALYPGSPDHDALSYSFFLAAASFLIGPSFEVVVAGDPTATDTREMVRALRERFLPDAVVIFRPADTSNPEIDRVAPFTSLQAAINGKATAYVCQNFACKLPTNETKTMLSELLVR